jgi:drug/metabolite transporter (DMT)-like permease
MEMGSLTSDFGLRASAFGFRGSGFTLTRLASELSTRLPLASNVRAVFAALLCTILFSVSITCGHRSAKLIGGMEANFWRLALAAGCLGVWAYALGVGAGGAAFPLFFLSGVIGIGIGDMAFFQTLPRLGSRLTALLTGCLSAPLAALIEWLWLGTKLSLAQILWGLVIVAAVGVALMPSEHVHRTRRALFIGTVYAVLASLCGAAGGVVSRKAYEVAHAGGGHIDGGNAAFQRCLGGLLLAGIGLLVVKRHALKVQAHAPHDLVVETSKRKWRGVWPWVLANGFAGQTLGVSCMQWALDTTPAGIVFAILAITPILIIPFARIMEDERPTLHSLVGGAIAVAGVIALAFSR